MFLGCYRSQKVRKLRNERPLYPSENRIFRRINICWSLIISKPIKYYVYNYIWPRQAEDGQTNTNGSPCPNTRKLFCVTPAQRGLGKYYLFLFSSFYSTWSTDIMNTPNTPYWTQPEHFQYQTTTQDSRAVNEPSRSFTVPEKIPTSSN